MKKKMITIIFIALIFIISNSYVYADWVSDAFSATSEFLNEPTKYVFGIVSPTFTFFQNIVKALNRILLVLLAGISTIALSVTGVRYMASGASPAQRETAQKSLKTIFIGMAFGFGAYTIWRIAMAIIQIMMKSFVVK